jgi:hypothetical protein
MSNWNEIKKKRQEAAVTGGDKGAVKNNWQEEKAKRLGVKPVENIIRLDSSKVGTIDFNGSGLHSGSNSGAITVDPGTVTKAKADRYKTPDVASKPDFTKFVELGKQKLEDKKIKVGSIEIKSGYNKFDNYKDFLTEEEMNTYNYWIGKGNDKNAKKYLSSITPELNRRMAERDDRISTELTKQNKAAGVAVDLIANFAAPAGIVETAKAFVTGEDIDPNSPMFAGTRTTQAVEKELFKNANSFESFLGQTGLSMAKFATALPFGQVGALSILSSGAAGNAAFDATNRGASTEEALAVGTLTGITEFLTEKLPLDNLMRLAKSNVNLISKEGIKQVLKQAGIEGSEEVVSQYVNTLTDIAIMGNRSTYEMYKAELIASGMSTEEAESKAKREFFIKEPALAFAGGALSGGVFGAGAAGVATYKMNQTGSTMRGMGIQQDIIDTGLESDPSTRSFKEATRVSEIMANGGKVSNADIGSLHYANIEAINAENDQVQKQGIRNMLIEKGAPVAEADKVSSVVQRAFAGDPLSNTEAETIIKNDIARELFTAATGYNIPLGTMSEMRRSIKQFSEDVVSGKAKPIYSEPKIEPQTDEKVNEGITPQINPQPAPAQAPAIPAVQSEGVYNREDIKGKISKLGKSGQKSFGANMQGRNDMDSYSKAFSAYYIAGRTGLPIEEVEKSYSQYGQVLSPEVKYSAYSAGKNDVEAESKEQAKTAGSMKTYDKKESGIKETKGINKNVAKAVDLIGKATGTKVKIVDTIEVGGKKGAANGFYKDGTISIAKDADNPLFIVAKHEVTHRLKDVSAKDYEAYKNHVVNVMTKNGTLEKNVERLDNLYKRNGQDLSYDEIMDEIAADFTEQIMTDEKAFAGLVSENRNLAQKLVDLLRELIEKVKASFRKTDINLKNTLGFNINDLQKAEEMWLKALKSAKNAESDTDVLSEEGMVSSYIKYSLVKDKDTLNFLEKQNQIHVYRAMQVISGKLYPPMAAKVAEDGKRNLVIPSEFGAWEQADERPDLIKNGKFTLDKANGSSIEASYNPYFHTSKSPLNDQFTSAHNRPNLVVVEGVVPESELTSGYHAQYAKDTVGEMNWHSGVVSSKLPEGKKRKVILSRWFKPLRIVPDSEVAQKIATLLDGEDISIPINTVTPSLRKELEKLGVPMGEQRGLKYSLKDSDGNTLSQEQEEYFKDSKVRDQKGNLRVMYHGTKTLTGRNHNNNPEDFSIFNRNSHFGTMKQAELFTIQEETEMITYKNREIIKSTKNERIYPVYLNIKNPMRSVDLNRWEDAINKAKENGYDGIVYLNRYEGITDKEGTPIRTLKEINTRIVRIYGDKLSDNNDPIDGITDEEFLKLFNASDSYIAFDPEQVKSVFNTEPTNDPDIRYSLKDSEGNDLSPEQAEFFKESKVKDEEGNLHVVYHGTEKEFTVFKETGSHANDRGWYGRGFYFATSEGEAAYYGSKVSRFYLNIVKPFNYFEEMTTLNGDEINTSMGADTIIWAKNLIEKFPELAEEKMSISYKLPDVTYESFVKMADQIFNKISATEVHTDRGIEYWYEYNGRTVLRSKNNEMADKYNATYFALSDELDRQSDYTAKIRIPEKYMQALGDSMREILENRGYDGINAVDEIIAFKPEQIKFTDNKNPSEDPDIRFSLKGETKILKENAMLKEMNEQLKAQFQKTTKPAVDRKKTEAYGKSLLKEYSSYYDKNQLTDELNALYNEMSGDVVDYEAMKRKANEISFRLLDSSSVVNSEMYQQYRDLIKRTKETPLKVNDLDKKEISYIVGDYNEFRKKTFGTMKLVNSDYESGLTVDEFYQSLTEDHPELFDEELTNQGEQLVAIRDVIKSLKPFEENPYSEYMDEAVEFLTYDILDQFYQIPNAKPTFADKQERTLALAKIKAQEALRTERARRVEQIEKVKEYYRKKERKHAQAVSNRNMRIRIERIVNDLSKKLLDPTDKQHVPDILRKPVADFLSSIDFSSNRQQEGTRNKLAGLQNAYLRIAAGLDRGDSDFYLDIDPDFINIITDLIDTIGDKRVIDMNSKELEKLYQIARVVKSTISNYNKLMYDDMRQDVFFKGESVIFELKTDTPKNESGYEFIRAFDRLVNINMLAPADFFDGLGNQMQDLYRNIRKGLDKKIDNMKLVTEYMTDLIKDKDISDWTGNKAKSTVYPLKRKSIELTPAQVMSLYLLSKREQARDHIYIGGIKHAPQTKKVKGKVVITKAFEPVQVTEAEVANIISTLTPEQRKVADGISDFLNTYTSQWGNEISMKLYGYRKFTEKNYFPIKSDDNYLVSEFGTYNDPSLKGKGWTKATIRKANNPIIIDDIFDVFSKMADESTSYNAFVIPLSDMQKVVNYRGAIGSVKQAIEKKYGKEAIKYISKLMIDINGGLRTDIGVDFIGRLLSNYKAATMGLNPRVIIQQPTALLRAMAMIEPKYLAKGIATKGDWKKVIQYSPIAQWKSWGYFNLDIGRQLKDIFMGEKHLNDTFFAAIQAADNMAWARLWNAVEYEIKDTRTDLVEGTPLFYEAVSRRFSDIVDRTQVVDTVLHRTQIMRSNDTMIKVYTSFMAEPMKSYNMLRTSIKKAVETKSPEDKKRAVRTTLSWLSAVAVNSLIVSLIDVYRHSEDDDEFIEKYIESFLGNAMNDFTGMIPFIRDVASMANGFAPKRMELDGVNDVLKAVKKFGEYTAAKFKGEQSEYTVAFIMKDTISSISKLFGIPINNVKREIESFLKNYIRWTNANELDYAMTKTFNNINNSENRSLFVNILYKTVQDGDKDAAKRIYNDMLINGIQKAYIEQGLRSRMRKTLDGTSEIKIMSESVKEWEDTPKEKRTEAMKEKLKKEFDANFKTLMEMGYADKDIQKSVKRNTSSGSVPTMKVLLKAYKAGQEDESKQKDFYELYNQMIDSGYEAEDIAAAIEAYNEK